MNCLELNTGSNMFSLSADPLVSIAVKHHDMGMKWLQIFYNDMIYDYYTTDGYDANHNSAVEEDRVRWESDLKCQSVTPTTWEYGNGNELHVYV